MLVKDRRLFTYLLLVSLALYPIFAPTMEFTSAQQIANEVTVLDVALEPNALSSRSIPVKNPCKQTQTFTATLENLPYLKFQDGPTLIVTGESIQELPVIFDIAGMKPGKYQGTAKVKCDTCLQSNCPLTLQTITVRLVITEAAPGQPTTPPGQPTTTKSPAAQQTDRQRAQAAAVLAALEKKRQRDRQRADREKVLNEQGPQFPESYKMDDFSIEGFVKGNWPAIVEYELYSPATAVLTIEVEGAKPFTQVLKGTRQVRIEIQGLPTTSQVSEQTTSQQVTFRLPPEFGAKPQVARISIKAIGAPNQQKPPDFRLLALGLGDEAVGSVTIDQLTFQSLGSQNYAYTFRALRPFEKWGAEIMLISLAPDGSVSGTRVRKEPTALRVVPGTQKNGFWDGKSDSGQISRGYHRVQVRVWKTLSGVRGGDWVARTSQEGVQVQ